MASSPLGFVQSQHSAPWLRPRPSGSRTAPADSEGTGSQRPGEVPSSSRGFLIITVSRCQVVHTLLKNTSFIQSFLSSTNIYCVRAACVTLHYAIKGGAETPKAIGSLDYKKGRRCPGVPISSRRFYMWEGRLKGSASPGPARSTRGHRTQSALEPGRQFKAHPIQAQHVPPYPPAGPGRAPSTFSQTPEGGNGF